MKNLTTALTPTMARALAAKLLESADLIDKQDNEKAYHYTTPVTGLNNSTGAPVDLKFRVSLHS